MNRFVHCPWSGLDELPLFPVFNAWLIDGHRQLRYNADIQN